MPPIVAVLIFLPLLILIHELGHFVAAKLCKMQVEEFAIGLGPKLITLWHDGETAYTIHLLPFGGFVRLLGENESDDPNGATKNPRSFANKSALARTFVLSAGVIMNLFAGLVLIAIVLLSLGKPNPIPTIQINQISPDSPAMAVDLPIKSYIVGYRASQSEATTFTTDLNQEAFINFIKQNLNFPIDLQIQADLANLETVSVYTLTPRANPPVGQGALGIEFQQSYIISYEKIPTLKVIPESIVITIDLVIAIGHGFADLISTLVTKGDLPEGITGPVGIVKLTSEAAQQGIFQLFQLMALISINLAIMNLLPIPALDGGRIFFSVFELITRRKLLAKYEGWIHTIGFIFLMILVVLITFKDVRSFF